MKITLTAVAASFAIALLPATVLADEPDYSGKTIRAIVSYAAGGPVDLFGRLVARHINRHLPGEPNVIVENMPGASGVVAANYVYNAAPKDGTVFLVTIAPFTTQYIGDRPVKFDSAKFNWIGALNISQATYVSKMLGVKSLADLAKNEQQVVIGGLGSTAARDLRMRALLEALGITDYKYVTGYRGSLPARNALLRNEVNLSDEALFAIVVDLASEVRDGNVIPIAQTGLTRDGKRVLDPQTPHIPVAEEAVVAIKGDAVRDTVPYRALSLVTSMATLGRAVLAAPDVDPKHINALRKAYNALNSDPDFQKDAARLSGGVEMTLIAGEEAQTFAKNMANLVQTDREALDFLNELTTRKGESQ